MAEILQIIEKEEVITDVQRTQIYELCTKISKETLEEVCPTLLRIALNSEKGKLKNQLGQVIFHLQKNERLNTVIGLQKLLDAALIVDPDAMLKLLDDCDEDAQELANKIKAIL